MWQYDVNLHVLHLAPLLSNVQNIELFLVLLNHEIRFYNEVSTTKLLFLPSMFFQSIFLILYNLYRQTS